MEEFSFLEKDGKKIFKKDINRLSRALTYYQLSVLTVIFIWGFYIFMKEYDEINSIVDNDIFLDSIQLHYGLIYICGILIGMLFIRRYYKKHLSPYDLNTVNAKMNFRKFMTVLVILMSLQLVHTSISSLMEIIFNFFGYSINTYIESSKVHNHRTISMFIYIIFSTYFRRNYF